MGGRTAAASVAGVLTSVVALTAVAAGSAVAQDGREALCAEAMARLAEVTGLPPAKPGTVPVAMYKYTFCPVNLTIKAGTTVRFVNVDKRTSHSVWFKEAGREESNRLFPDEYWEMTFDVPGSYPYLCGPHWEQQGMIGGIEVTP